MTLTEFSRKGGRAGKGDSKRRSPEHYRRLVECRAAARRLRAWAKDKGGERALKRLKGD